MSRCISSSIIEHGGDFPANIAITYVSFYWLGVFTAGAAEPVSGIPQSASWEKQFGDCFQVEDFFSGRFFPPIL